MPTKHRQVQEQIKSHFDKHKKVIRRRLNEFSYFYHNPVVWSYQDQTMKLIPSIKHHNHRLFEELTFCILAANTSAEMGMTCVDILRPHLQDKSWEELKQVLIGNYRFINLRPQYIVHTRSYLDTFEFKLKEKLESFHSPLERTEFLANNPGIKGIGYKEASHFLRNVGFTKQVILDKHIINCMRDAGFLRKQILPTTKKNYAWLSQKYLSFSNKLDIDPDELDLTLWSFKTGKVLK